jgi:hypothetical protein
MLYEKRTGLSLPLGTVLSVPRLLSSVPEISLELEASGAGKRMTEIIYHAIASDVSACWVLLATTGTGFLAQPQHVTTKLFNRHFDRFDTSDFPKWRELFALSARIITRLVVLQSKRTFSMSAPDGSVVPNFAAGFTHLREVASPYVNDSLGSPVDAVLTPSLRSRALPMPTSLARYALMFYLSSLVRYKPSALDPIRESQAAWLFDSFAAEAPLLLLANSLSGIIDRPVVFEASGYRT